MVSPLKYWKHIITKLLSCFCCLHRTSMFMETSRYKRFVSNSKSTLTKEMDLKKFLIRQRLQTTAVLGLLSGRQSYLVDKMSQLIIRESSNFEETSCDSELSDWQRDNMQYARSMTHSTDKVDKRLISLYMMSKAHEQGHTFGL